MERREALERKDLRVGRDKTENIDYDFGKRNVGRKIRRYTNLISKAHYLFGIIINEFFFLSKKI